MRIWVLLLLFVVLASGFYFGFDTQEYSEKSAALVAGLDDS